MRRALLLTSERRNGWRQYVVSQGRKELILKFSRHGRSRERAMIELDQPIPRRDGNTLLGYSVFIDDVSIPVSDHDAGECASANNVVYTFTFIPVHLESRAS